MDLDHRKRRYPPSSGWDLFEIGNRVIAVDRWGGAQKVVHRKPLLPEGTIRIPELWRYKPREK